MAVFRATFTPVSGTRSFGQGLPAPLGTGATGLTELTTSGTSQNVQSGGADFEAPAIGIVSLRATGDVWVSFGAAPTAAVEADWFIASGTDRDFVVLEDDKIAVIDDS